MSKENRDHQIHIRLTKKEKEKVKIQMKNYGYTNISKFIMDNLIYEKQNKKESDGVVYTITLSPTLDYFINIESTNNLKDVEKFTKENINFSAGGRGINTSKVLNEFNVPNTSVYIAGGFTGDKIQNILDKRGIKQYRINNDIETRININLVDYKANKSLEELQCNISITAKEALLAFVDQHLNPNDKVVMSGSFTDEDKKFVIQLSKHIRQKCKNIYLNSSSKDILEIAKHFKPKFLLLDSNNSDSKTKKDIKEFSKKFIEMGIDEVAFFLDENYTYYFTKDNTYLLETKLNENAMIVGSGDAFVAGIISNESKQLEEKIKWASASQKAKSISMSKVMFKEIANLVDEVNIMEE